MKYIIYLWAVTSILTACTSKTEPNQSQAMDPKSNLVAQGKKIYAQNCIACHNPNPKLDGAIGPAVSGSSLELLNARVLHAKYPANYKAKRDTHLMPALPGLESEIPALNAFLNQ